MLPKKYEIALTFSKVKRISIEVNAWGEMTIADKLYLPGQIYNVFSSSGSFNPSEHSLTPTYANLN